MRVTIDPPIRMDSLITPMHELVDKNTEMQTELPKLHQQKYSNHFIQLSIQSHDDEQRDAIPKDTFACNRKAYKHLYEEESSDSESTAGDNSSVSSFSSSCSRCNQRERPRRVRFAMETDRYSLRSGIAAEYSSSPGPITPEEHVQLWYKLEDYRHFRKYSRKLASVAAASRYRQELEEVLEVCEKATTQDVTHCSRIANTGVRGLEISVSENLTIKRRAAIRGVLEAQRLYRENHAGEDLETNLYTTSRTLSRSARLMARILGNGDYAVARSLK